MRCERCRDWGVILPSKTVLATLAIGPFAGTGLHCVRQWVPCPNGCPRTQPRIGEACL